MEEVKYTLAAITSGSKILVIKRVKKPYIGHWNGIGGKVEHGESLETGMVREIQEETGLLPTQYKLQFSGILEWSIDGKLEDRIALFKADLISESSETNGWADLTHQTREGLLAFKEQAWLTQSDNQEVVPDFKAILPEMMTGKVQRYFSNFENESLVSFTIEPYR